MLPFAHFICESEMSRATRLTDRQICNIISSWDTDDEIEDEMNIHEESSDSDIANIGNNQGDCSSTHSEDEEQTENQHNTATDNSYIGRDGTLWNKCPGQFVGRTAAHNVFLAQVGVPRRISNIATSPYDAWKEFVDEKMLRAVVKHTVDYARSCGDHNFVLSVNDAESFIAIQYCRGLYGKSHPAHFLWNKEHGIPLFSKIMSRDRYLEILKYLRFDNKSARVRVGPSADKFAPIRELFDLFVNNCETKYTPSFSLTVDEQLLPLKSRCGFITFMPNKPDKYGLKFWVLAEVDTKYVVRVTPYLGAQEKFSRGNVPLAEAVVMDLVQPIKGKGYNVCTDNFFTSLPLAKKLCENKISLVGTMRKNRRELCSQMTEPTKGGLYSSFFCWYSGCNALFVRYQAKAKKTVCLLSTMHNSASVSDGTKQKPDVILFYNKNKVGVDSYDQMNRYYSTHSASRRWPMAVWSNILDTAAINARVVYMKSCQLSITRRNFLLCLIDQLHSKPGSEAIETRSTVIRAQKRRKCSITGCENATTFVCMNCKKPTCGVCAQPESKTVYVMCKNC